MEHNPLFNKFNDAVLNRIKFFAPQRALFLRVIKKILLGRLGYLKLLCHKSTPLKHSIVRTRIFSGVPLYINLQDTYTENLLVFGTLSDKEAPLTRFLIKHVTRKDIFYDIGASYGFYSVLVGSMVPTNTVHVFEPSESVFSCLVKTNEINKNMILNKIALGNVKGTVVFYDFAKNRTGSESAIALTTDRDASEYDTYEVKAQTLDSYLSTKPKELHPTVLKVDIESAEYEFLLGAHSFLKNYSPVIAMELKVFFPADRELSQKCFTFLSDIGYSAYRIDVRGDLTPVTLQTLATVDTVYENFVFKK